MLKIWSLRFTPAQGNHWSYERDATPETVQQWLAVFRADEPNVTFIATARKPARPKSRWATSTSKTPTFNGKGRGFTPPATP